MTARWRSGNLGKAASRRLCGIVFAAVAVSAAPVLATTSERIVTDRHSGVAIFGFDPVAYFVSGNSVEGASSYEAAYAGVTWRFANEGDRRAFLANPEVYSPRFGGYDPMEVIRGKAVPGHPQVWTISGKRLYFFHSEETRDAFLKSPDAAIVRAQEVWPDVEAELPR